ncbi:S9 family peptidase [Vibrio metschnikovii]|nr:S9 family peptidase [Vibrio metschnikovii]EKO3690269.1 S9 family peptidase [Vibrio metschnikovii]EKO3693110.1 S9 family peptidase [Vibrio metschnikovii]EKO3780037.1 S9 family peptidase [Vibrio metschnikovii]EKO3887464.1 S9 family peptidase [Vibrio metschnikovii]
MKYIFAICSLFILLSNTVLAQDPQAWLRDSTRQSSAVLEYLQANNLASDDYFRNLESVTTHLIDQWRLMVGESTDSPWLIHGDFEWRLSQHQQQLVLQRRSRDGGESKIIYDFTPRQQVSAYYDIGSWVIQPASNHLFFTEDIQGNESYRAVKINLSDKSEQILATHLSAQLTIPEQGNTLYVIGKNHETQRADRLMAVSSLASFEPVILWHEERADWMLSFYRASDSNYLIVQSNNEQATEQRILNFSTGKLSSPLKESKDSLEYYADIRRNKLYINSNFDGEFTLYQADIDSFHEWKRFSQQINGIQQFYLFSAGIAITEQQGEDLILSAFDYDSNLRKRIKINQPGEVAWISHNGDFASNEIRIRSMSLISPPQWQKFAMDSLVLSTISQDHYPNYRQQDYHTQQISASYSGVDVPITLAYRKDKLTETSPVILYGYGAYGYTMKPYFMPQIISLLDQGFIYTIAHVRGGGYFNNAWHDAGRGMLKPNSINDFISAAQTLRRYAPADNQHPTIHRQIFALGSSAGGTLVAGALNQAPGLFSAAVLKVPFVDVINSMSDPTLPLSEQQYREWGNPNHASELAIMRTYDPYHNIKALSYPPLLVQIGLHDQRVPFWEGAKYLTQIRALTSGKGPYLLQTDFESGHVMDRRKSLQQQAKEYAFFISLANLSNKTE